MGLEEKLATTVVGNTLFAWLVAVIVFAGAFALLKLFKYVIIARLRKLSTKTKTDLDDAIVRAIDRIGWPFYGFLSLYLGLLYVALPAWMDRWLSYALMFLFVFYAVLAVQEMIGFAAVRIAKRHKGEDDSAIRFLATLVKVSLWFIALLLILSNLGYDVTTLIAGLGIGGIAIALALQTVLGDLFASFAIYFDKPFKVGDFIIVGDTLGVVKKIGIKTTRLESLWGQEVVISNSELTSTRINNYKRMHRRRIHMTFGVVYQTPMRKMKEALKIVKEIFAKVKLADLDRVHFKAFSQSSLDFEVAYYVNTKDYNEYMDVQQELLFLIKERFEKAGISFAYPTQTLFLEKDGKRRP